MLLRPILVLLFLLAGFARAATPATAPALTLEAAGLRWTALVHTPPGYDSTKKYPVVILVHGGGGDDAEYAAKAYGLTEKADREGFLAVFPNTAAEKVGERPENAVDAGVTMISALLDEAEKKYAVDANRVYLCGHSNGAMLTYRAATELGDRIAAFGVVAGTVGTQERDEQGRTVAVPAIPQPKRAVPLIVFHGKKDDIIPYDSGTCMTVAESVGFWVAANGCAPTAVRTELAGGRVIREAYSPKDPKSGADIVLYTLLRGNHMWPGGKAMPGKDERPVQDISATDLMWAFFEAHPRVGTAKEVKPGGI